MTKNSTQGFSLLEVLVALSIMALSLGVLYQAAGGSVRNAAHLERHAYAVVIAEGLLARTQATPPEGISASAETPDGFRWSLISTPYAGRVGARDSAEGWPFHGLRAEVVWESLGREHRVTLETVVPVLDQTKVSR